MSTEYQTTSPVLKYERSTSCGSIALALAKAQAEMENAAKDASNPAFRSSYATLAAVRNACIPQLSKNEIAVVQVPSTRLENGAWIAVIRTEFIHSSDQWFAGTLEMPVTGRNAGDAQGVGSALSYARRYSLSAMAGISQEDDDANAGSGKSVDQMFEKPAYRPSKTEQAKSLLKKSTGFKEESNDAYGESLQNMEPPPDVDLPGDKQASLPIPSNAPNSDMVTMDFGNQMTKGKFLKDLSIKDLSSALEWLTTKAPDNVRTKHSRLEAAIGHQLKQRGE